MKIKPKTTYKLTVSRDELKEIFYCLCRTDDGDTGPVYASPERESIIANIAPIFEPVYNSSLK